MSVIAGTLMTAALIAAPLIQEQLRAITGSISRAKLSKMAARLSKAMAKDQTLYESFVNGNNEQRQSILNTMMSTMGYGSQYDQAVATLAKNRADGDKMAKLHAARQTDLSNAYNSVSNKSARSGTNAIQDIADMVTTKDNDQLINAGVNYSSSANTNNNERG